MRRPTVWAVALLVCHATAFGQQLVDPSLRLTTVVGSLQQPTGLALLPTAPGAPVEMLAIEKATGRVLHIEDGAVQGVALDLAVNRASERGLLGITLHPAHATNGFIYVYYTRSTTGDDSFSSAQADSQRVERYTWTGSTLTSAMTVLMLPSDPGPNHDGGVILFGPDGKLYGVIGDLNRNGQLENFPTGAPPDDTAIIFRINDDGTEPTDNPFFSLGGTMRKVFAYGIRNSFGLDFDPLTSVLWQTENGPNRMDEINRVLPGFNSGWEPLMGPESRDDSSVKDLWRAPGSSYADPLFSWQSPIGVTSIHIVRGDVLGAPYAHDILIGDSRNGSLYHFVPTASRADLVFPTAGTMDRVADSPAERDTFLFGSGFGTVTDIETGPDGVYVCSFSGSIYRVYLDPTTVQPSDWGDIKALYRGSGGKP